MRLRLSSWEKYKIREEARDKNISYKGIIEFLSNQNSNNFEQDLYDAMSNEDNIIYIRTQYGEYEGEYPEGDD